MFAAPVEFDAAVRLVSESRKEYGWDTFHHRNQVRIAVKQNNESKISYDSVYTSALHASRVGLTTKSFVFEFGEDSSNGACA